MSSDRETLSLADVLQEACVRATLTLLEGAYHCALTVGRPPWDFALAATELHKTGVTDGHLELLRAAHVLERRTQLLPSVSNGHTPCTLAPAVVIQDAAPWFVLSPAGARMAAQARQGGSKVGPHWDASRCERMAPAAPPEAAADELDKEDDSGPSYEGRVFRCGGQVLKVFTRHAPEQERVLEEEQRAGWPPWLPNPLVRDGHRHCARQLRDTLRLLNRAQDPWRIHFDIDPQGQGVRWSLRHADG